MTLEWGQLVYGVVVVLSNVATATFSAMVQKVKHTQEFEKAKMLMVHEETLADKQQSVTERDLWKQIGEQGAELKILRQEYTEVKTLAAGLQVRVQLLESENKRLLQQLAYPGGGGGKGKKGGGRVMPPGDVRMHKNAPPPSASPTATLPPISPPPTNPGGDQ